MEAVSLVIPDDFLQIAHMTEADLKLEIAILLLTVSEWENGAYDPDRSTAKFLELIA